VTNWTKHFHKLHRLRFIPCVFVSPIKEDFPPPKLLKFHLSEQQEETLQFYIKFKPHHPDAAVMRMLRAISFHSIPCLSHEATLPSYSTWAMSCIPWSRRTGVQRTKSHEGQSSSQLGQTVASPLWTAGSQTPILHPSSSHAHSPAIQKYKIT